MADSRIRRSTRPRRATRCSSSKKKETAGHYHARQRKAARRPCVTETKVVCQRAIDACFGIARDHGLCGLAHFLLLPPPRWSTLQQLRSAVAACGGLGRRTTRRSRGTAHRVPLRTAWRRHGALSRPRRPPTGGHALAHCVQQRRRRQPGSGFGCERLDDAHKRLLQRWLRLHLPPLQKPQDLHKQAKIVAVLVIVGPWAARARRASRVWRCLVPCCKWATRRLTAGTLIKGRLERIGLRVGAAAHVLTGLRLA